MKKLLLLTLAIVTLINLGYSQNRPIQRGGIVVYEKDGHGLVAAPTDLGIMDLDSAKTACDTLTLNGYSDWHLPSKEELNALYVNLKQLGVGGFAGDYYWSSTESGNDAAWLQNFDNGWQEGYGGKDGKYDVRAVRAF